MMDNINYLESLVDEIKKIKNVKKRKVYFNQIEKKNKNFLILY